MKYKVTITYESVGSISHNVKIIPSHDWLSDMLSDEDVLSVTIGKL